MSIPRIFDKSFSFPIFTTQKQNSSCLSSIGIFIFNFRLNAIDSSYLFYFVSMLCTIFFVLLSMILFSSFLLTAKRRRLKCQERGKTIYLTKKILCCCVYVINHKKINVKKKKKDEKCFVAWKNERSHAKKMLSYTLYVGMCVFLFPYIQIIPSYWCSLKDFRIFFKPLDFPLILTHTRIYILESFCGMSQKKEEEEEIETKVKSIWIVFRIINLWAPSSFHVVIGRQKKVKIIFWHLRRS